MATINKYIGTAADVTSSWLAAAVANTTVTNTIIRPDVARSRYEVSAYNESLITDLTWKLYNLQAAFGGETRRCLLASKTLLKSAAVVVEDCEDAWNELAPANVTIAADAVDYKVGANSVKITLAANAGAGIKVSEAISSHNMSIYTHIYAWIKSDIGTAAGDLKIMLDNTAECASPLETIDVPALTAATWTRVILPLANPASDLAIISVGIYRPTVTVAQVINIDDVEGVTMTQDSVLIEGLFGGGNAMETKSNDTGGATVVAFSSGTRISEA